MGISLQPLSFERSVDISCLWDFNGVKGFNDLPFAAYRILLTAYHAGIEHEAWAQTTNDKF
jgi:hypothetical protein